KGDLFAEAGATQKGRTCMSLVRAALTFLAIIILVSLFGSRAAAQLTKQSLREVAKRPIKNNSPGIDLPKFYIDDYCLYYRLGGHRRYPSDGRDPLQLPVDTQIRIELIRSRKWP